MFKRLLHVLILRSSSGSTYCSLLNLYVKMVNTLLYVPVMQQHIMSTRMCICCIPCREVGRLTDLPAEDMTYTQYPATSLEHITKLM